MPYIVTTKRRVAIVSARREPGEVADSRHAVATLKGPEGARRRACEAVCTAMGTPWDDENPYYNAATTLPESGGTVGPLPDGTVIKVEQISPLMLASRIGASGEEVMSCLRADDFGPLIAAFNARGASGDA